MEGRIVVIDGNSLINRAYYAMQRPMITKKGFYTQAIFGFINMLNKILREYEPEYMVVCWDRKTPTFRHEAYDEYKAGRRKMPPELAMEIPKMKEILSAMNIDCEELDRYEADDLIGTISRVAEERGLSPLIITGDRDALQLASEKTSVLITKKGISEFELYDDQKMKERYELTPEQFIDLKGLMGDKSDNIPGIPGVGEKTGIKLLKQFGSLENVVTQSDQIKNAKLRQKVKDNAQTALMSKKLATIDRNAPIDVDLDACRLDEPDEGRLIELYKELEFNKFLSQMEVSGNSAKETEALPEFERKVLAGEEDLAVLRSEEAGSPVVIRVFSDNNHVEKPVIDGVSLLVGGTCYFIPSALIEPLVDILNEKNFRFQGHNLIRDYYALISFGLRQADTLFDTQIVQYVLDSARSNYDLNALALEYLHAELRSEKEFREESAQVSLLSDPNEEMEQYGYEWCTAVLGVKAKQKERIREAGQDRLLQEVEFPLVEVLAFMEYEGIDVDPDVLEKTGSELSEKISSLEQEIYDRAGEEFNINSPIQLGQILFEKMGLPAGKKTKRGYSTSADVLEKIRGKDPIVGDVLEYRTYTKLKSTYIEGLRPLIGPDGRIHAHFQQTVAATGRLSCTEPNLQNIPVRQELGRKLRKAFNAGEGNTLISADYSQIELRILAHLSGDENLIRAFNNKEDIHRTTASRVFDIPYEDVTPLDRSRAKAVNFGVIYGMSGFGLSEELGITRKEAERYIQDYFVKHPKVKAYMDGQLAFCREHLYTETILGRRRYINEIKAKNYMQRQLGERLAMNSPIQGSAADIIKIAMIRMFRALRENGLQSRLILQIHDELIVRTREDEREQVKALLRESMEQAMELKVELTADVNEAYSWYDLKD
ncbi:MAG: DNA polymerase I [Anaerovoracaceae bacterium]|jgi:DNA polymerase-1